VPKDQLDFYERIAPELQNAVEPYLQISGTSHTRLDDIMRHLEGNLPDLITFNPSIVDQEPWERVSAGQFVEDGDSAEVSLL